MFLVGNHCFFLVSDEAHVTTTLQQQLPANSHFIATSFTNSEQYPAVGVRGGVPILHIIEKIATVTELFLLKEVANYKLQHNATLYVVIDMLY